MGMGTMEGGGDNGNGDNGKGWGQWEWGQWEGVGTMGGDGDHGRGWGQWEWGQWEGMGTMGMGTMRTMRGMGMTWGGSGVPGAAGDAGGAMGLRPAVSLDAVREALGVTQESHVVPCLATVTAVCQVALWGAERSEGHLAAAAEDQRRQAARYGRMAQNVANAAAEATEAAGAIGAANAVRETLEEVSNQLRLLANAVTRDVEAARGFTGSGRVLGNAVKALGAVLKDEEGTQRLARALQGLRGEE